MRPLKQIDTEALKDAYLNKRMTLQELSKTFNTASSVLSDRLKSMGIPIRTSRIDLTNRRFGKLVVVSFSHREDSSAVWNCRCDCGGLILRCSPVLRKGIAKCCGCSWRKAYEGISSKMLFSLARNAQLRGLKFQLSPRELWDLFLKQNRKCAITGIDLVLESRIKLSSKTTASLDRIDSNKDYTLDNVQWVHKDVNIMKWDFPESCFFKLVKRIYEHNRLDCLKD